MQMGLGPKALRKLQSCLVAAEAACSSGDLPVVAVESRLAAVVGLAIAIEVAAVPAELAAAVVELLKASRGAAQPVVKHPRMRAQRVRRVPIKKQTKPKDLICLVGLPRESVYLRLQTTLNTPAVQDSLTTGSNSLFWVLLSETTLPLPLLPENSLYAIGR